MRLDDFWSLRLCRPTQSQLLRRCQFLIRKCQFREWIATDSVKAMFYLQTQLSQVVDRSNDEQMAEFHHLTNLLFHTKEQREEDQLFHGCLVADANDHDNGHQSPVTDAYRLRSNVFDSLVQYFPETMSQPRLNLTDLVASDLQA